MSEKADKCEICGKGLYYATSQEDYKDLECIYCKEKFNTNTYCPEGHFICDSCHSEDVIKVMKTFCETTDLKDPFVIADNLMKHPKFKLYGPEHHILTPLAILTSLKNNGVKKTNGEEITSKDLTEAIVRSSKIPGGWCGFYGSCGAGMGSGVAISILTGATPSRNEPRTLANQMTARSLVKIADNLEHCCKRSLKISIAETLEFLKENFNIDLNFTPENCKFSAINSKCEREKCQFFKM